MMGSEERSGTIFKASFVLTKLKEQHMHRTHFVPRPARDNSPPQTRNRKLLLLVRSSITGLFALSRLHFPCLAEIRAAHPDAMQDDRQPPGQGDDCLLYPATRRHFHCPCFQPRPFGRPCQHYLSCLIEKRPRHSIATQRDPAKAFTFAGLIKDRGQSKGRPDSLGPLEAGRNVDGGGEGHGYYRADSWDRHQTPAHRVISHDRQQLAVKDGKQFAQLPAGLEKRVDYLGPACRRRARVCATRTWMHRWVQP